MTNLRPAFLRIAILRPQILVSHFFVSQIFVSAELCLRKSSSTHFFVSRIFVCINLRPHKSSSAKLRPQNFVRKTSSAKLRLQIFVRKTSSANLRPNIFVYSFLLITIFVYANHCLNKFSLAFLFSQIFVHKFRLHSFVCIFISENLYPQIQNAVSATATIAVCIYVLQNRPPGLVYMVVGKDQPFCCKVRQVPTYLCWHSMKRF